MAKRPRAGGSTTKGKRNNVQENDIFFHPFVSNALIKALSVHINNKKLVNAFLYDNKFRVLDACCGAGALGTSFKKHFKNSTVDFVDIMNQTGLKRFKKLNIAYWKPSYQYDVILCNPPWIPVEIPMEIYYKTIDLLKPTGTLFYIINNTFCYQGPKRGKRLKFQKYYFLPCYTFASAGRERLDCGVMVYHKDGQIPLEAVQRDCFIELPRINSYNRDRKPIIKENEQLSIFSFFEAEKSVKNCL